MCYLCWVVNILMLNQPTDQPIYKLTNHQTNHQPTKQTNREHYDVAQLHYSSFSSIFYP